MATFAFYPAAMGVENLAADVSLLDGDSRGHLAAIVGIFASIGLGMGITVFFVGQEAGGPAGVSLGGLMLWLLPYIGPALAAILGALSGATTSAGTRSTVLAPVIGALVGYVVMFAFIMPFMMAQPTGSAMPPMQVAGISMRSLPGTAIAAAVGGYLGVRFQP